MKSAVLATVSLFLAAPALAADPVSLLGSWKGEEAGVGGPRTGGTDTSFSWRSASSRAWRSRR
ncbi:hypothetical protein ACFSKM_02950 [Ancylobacter dichloromethanicus]